jgi:hypothetical protein
MTKIGRKMAIYELQSLGIAQVTNHGRLPCEFCSGVYKVNELHTHMTETCSDSYFKRIEIMPTRQENPFPNAQNNQIYKSLTNLSKEKLEQLRERSRNRHKTNHQKTCENEVLTLENDESTSSSDGETSGTDTDQHKKGLSMNVFDEFIDSSD